MELTIEQHLVLKPIRPNASTCTSNEWTEYIRAYTQWSNTLDLLRIDTFKSDIKFNKPGLGEKFL